MLRLHNTQQITLLINFQLAILVNHNNSKQSQLLVREQQSISRSKRPEQIATAILVYTS